MHSLRVKLVAWCLLLLASGLGIASTAVYWRLSGTLYHWVDGSLRARADELEDIIRFRDGRLVRPQPSEDTDTRSGDVDSAQGAYARVWDRRGGPPIVLDPAPIMPAPSAVRAAVARAFDAPRSSLSVLGADRYQDRCRVLLVPLPRPGSAAAVLEVGAPVLAIARTLDRLRDVLIFVGPLALLAMLFGCWILVGSALSPLNRLSHQATAIQTGNLSRGLEIPRGRDEVSRLALALNQMLMRLDAGFERERRFTADASHELRTPLAIMQSELEIALRSGGPIPRETALSVAQEVDRLRSLVNALLALSRSDADQMSFDREPVALDRLAAAVVEQMQSAAEEAGVSLHLATLTPVTALGDEARLIQVLLNLVDNALRYSPPGARVEVSLRREWNLDPPPDAAEIAVCEVRDFGSGISAEHLPHVFERFYRAETGSRAGGAGLGLPIAAAIAQAHSGKLEIESEPGLGTKARLILPLAPNRG